MAGKQGKIFISYRRDSGITQARLLRLELQKRGHEVFLDLENLRAGKFNEELLRRIESSSDFILVLSPGCLDRCLNKGDWVHKEIAHALKNGVNIVPVMLEGFTFPKKLPDDIEVIRYINAVPMNQVYYSESVTRLETFLVGVKDTQEAPKEVVSQPQKQQKSEPSKKVNKQEPKTQAAASKKSPKSTIKKWMWYAAAAVCVVALCLAGWLLYNSRDIMEADRSDATGYGNVSGNLCNTGYTTHNGSTSGGNQSITYLNRLEPWVYWYGLSSRCIHVKEIGNEPEVMEEIRDVGYLLVTTDWFYYTVENGNTTLYRAPRLEDGKSMGEAEVLLTGFSDDNNIIIEDNYVYYWKEGVGLYSYNIVKGKEKSLLEIEATWNYDLIGKFENWIYGYDSESIWRINIESGKLESVFAAADMFEDVEITGGNVFGSWIYVVLSDMGQDMVGYADRIYRMYPDGSQVSRVFVAESVNHVITAVNLCDTDDLYVSVCSGEENCLYQVDTESTEVLRVKPDDFTGFTKKIEVDGGNTLGNLCNNAFVARVDGSDTRIRNDSGIFYNRYSEVISYCYDPNEKKILLEWFEEDQYESVDLLTEVECSYLYVTPDWIYYTAKENGSYKLYRAENKVEESSIGTPMLLASDIAAENGIAIYNGWIYYWIGAEGLYRVRCDGRDCELLSSITEGKTCLGWATFNVTDEYLYFRSKNSLYKVSLKDEYKRTYFFDGSECLAGGKIVSAVTHSDNTVFAVQYVENGERTRPDEFWKVDAQGNATCLHTMSSMQDEMLDVNYANDTYYLKTKSQGVMEILYFNSDGELRQ